MKEDEDEVIALDELYLQTPVGPAPFWQVFDEATETPSKMVLPVGRFYGMYNSQELIALRGWVAQARMGRAASMQLLGLLDQVVVLPNGVTCTIEELREAIEYAEEV